MKKKKTVKKQVVSKMAKSAKTVVNRSSAPVTSQKSSFPIQPLSDKVLIKVDETLERMLPSGLIIPETAKQEKSDRGEVVAVGPGRLDENGKRIPMEVKVGDTVLYQWGDKIEFEGAEYYLVSESSVSAIIV
jgi:chaperonin GroES